MKRAAPRSPPRSAPRCCPPWTALALAWACRSSSRTPCGDLERTSSSERPCAASTCSKRAPSMSQIPSACVPTAIAPRGSGASAVTHADLAPSGNGSRWNERPSYTPSPSCVPTQSRPSVSNACGGDRVLWKPVLVGEDAHRRRRARGHVLRRRDRRRRAPAAIARRVRLRASRRAPGAPASVLATRWRARGRRALDQDHPVSNSPESSASRRASSAPGAGARSAGGDRDAPSAGARL